MGLFKGRMKGKFKQLFKRKPGGTVLGNLIRKGVNMSTGGLLGNGLFKLEEGETVENSNQRASDVLGGQAEALNAANAKYGGQVTPESIEKAARRARLKKLAGPIIAVIAVVVLILVFIFKRGK